MYLFVVDKPNKATTLNEPKNEQPKQRKSEHELIWVSTIQNANTVRTQSSTKTQ
jgi:hypothetical protein